MTGTRDWWSRVWTGRDDGADPLCARLHQRIQPLDLSDLASAARGSVAFVGYPTDLGVRANRGRSGAMAGPKALRRALANLPVHWDLGCFDCGDVVSHEEAVDRAQRTLGDAVRSLIAAGLRPLVLGGGHDIAYGTWLGVVEGLGERARGGVLSVNVDAHLDNRPLEDDAQGRTAPHSGTSYTQMQAWCTGQSIPFRAIALGVQRMSNTRFLLDRAQRAGYGIVWSDEVTRGSVQAAMASADAASTPIHLTIDLDVLAMSVAPGVSAPNGAGLLVDDVVRILDAVPWNRVAAVDIAELAPGLDAEERTARAAAAITFAVLERWTHP
ncbi:MAG: formimidoylglutamase [Planctomycetota bacterium]|nr:formimidoylglutamase [Planctomycetota bacterium]MDA1106011.1 formimidoylglutamase [Planctomycetota bacterium]